MSDAEAIRQIDSEKRLGLRNLYSLCSDVQLKGVGFVDPPVVNDDGLITPAHGWASAAVDRAIGLRSGVKEIVNAAWHEVGGLAVVILVPLRLVVSNNSEYRLEPIFDGVCAHIDFNTVLDRQYGLCMAKDCMLHNFEIVNSGGGCNPGGFVCFPSAPRYSDFLLRHRSRCVENGLEWSKRRFAVAPKMTVSLARELFPAVDWSSNEALDRLVRKCRVRVLSDSDWGLELVERSPLSAQSLSLRYRDPAWSWTSVEF